MESDSLAAVKKIPQRQCIGCNEMKDKKQLIRILKTQDEQIIIDTTGMKRGLERAFKMAVDASVYDELEKEMNNLGQ